MIDQLNKRRILGYKKCINMSAYTHLTLTTPQEPLCPNLQAYYSFKEHFAACATTETSSYTTGKEEHKHDQQ